MGMMAVAPRSTMAVWQRRVSKAPSAFAGLTAADRSAPWDLLEKVRQHGTVARAAGRELDRPDVPGGRIHGQMHLAPLPVATGPVLADLPLTIAAHLHAGAVDQQVQRPP